MFHPLIANRWWHCQLPFMTTKYKNLEALFKGALFPQSAVPKVNDLGNFLEMDANAKAFQK